MTSLLRKIFAIAGVCVLAAPAYAQSMPNISAKPPEPEAPWLNQTVYHIIQMHTMNGRAPINASYLEYEFFGAKGPLELFGYIDFPKILNLGNENSKGVWDGGSYFFTEIQPRLSLGKTIDKDVSIGPFKDWFLAADYTFDFGRNGPNSRSVNLYTGLGTTIDTGTPLRLQANAYKRYLGENYGLPNAKSWDGYRFQFVYSYPIKTFPDGARLSYGGYTNLDFGSKLHDLTGTASLTNEAAKSTHGITYSTKKYSLGFTAQYFGHGGQNRASTGWGGLIKMGLKF